VAPRPIAITADSAEYARYRGGTLELHGQAFLTTRGGDVKLAAGRIVTLDPATRYAREWFRRFGASVSAFSTPAPDRLFVAARRTTTADAEGRFQFSGLAPGEYIVRTVVTWETGSLTTPTQGGVVGTFVTIPRDVSSALIVNELLTLDLLAAVGVEIVDDTALATRRFRVIAPVTGNSCQEAPINPRPTEAEARADLLVSAARLGADAVAHVTCASRGMSLRPNCTSRIQCRGDAIAWI
jgi:hypothetical protein